jgi:hypothetical protein
MEYLYEMIEMMWSCERRTQCVEVSGGNGSTADAVWEGTITEDRV